MRCRFKAILIEADSYLLELVHYIHLNPVRAGLVAKPADYPWSSHRLFLRKRAKVEWLVREEVLRRFGNTWEKAVQRYREYVSHGVPASLEEVYHDGASPVILGAEGFLAGVRRFLSGRKGDYEIAESKDRRFRPGVEEAFVVCERLYGVQREAFRGVRRGHWNEPRDVWIYLCRRECGLSLKEIARELGIRAYTTVSMAYARVEARFTESRSFRHKVERLARQLRCPVNCPLKT